MHSLRVFNQFFHRIVGMDNEGASGRGRGRGNRRSRPRRTISDPQPRTREPQPPIPQEGLQPEVLEHSTPEQSRRTQRSGRPSRGHAFPSRREPKQTDNGRSMSGRIAHRQTPVSDSARESGNGLIAQQQQDTLNAQATEFYPLLSLQSSPLGKNKKQSKFKKPNKRAGNKEKKGKEEISIGLEQQHQQQQQEEEGNDHGRNGDNMPPNCLLCCNPAEIVAFGRCNHPIACAKCCLRLRICYKRTDCPLCKTDTQDIVISYWRSDLPTFEHFTDSKNLNVVRTRPGQLGPGVIHIDTWRPKGPASSKLFHELKRMTAISCALCSPSVRQQFSNLRILENHVKAEHGRYMCVVCLREGREFPLDVQIFESMASVKKHAAANHPRCSFCRGRAFYDGDLLWTHMMENHFKCQVCQSSGLQDEAWFANVDDLRSHLATLHFACEDPECVVCLVAFPTAEELRRHTMQRHRGRMTRWNSSSASRRLDVDIQFSRRARQPSVRGFAHESDGGMAVIDDDLGMLWDTERAESRSSDRETAEQREAFPALAPAASANRQAPARTTTMTGSQSGSERGRGPPPLVKHTVRCPCGRRVTYPVVEEGQSPPPIQCDAVCQLESRRHALADAFGISDPDHHVSVFDRKPVEWSGALLHLAKQDMAWVEGIEKELRDFIVDGRVKRRVLVPMNRQNRMAVHNIAQQYGLASASVGQEPKRAVELFKADQGAMLPAQLLSRVAASVSDAQVEAMLQAALKFPVLFDQITPTLDIHYYLRRWEGQYEVEWKGGSTVIVRFERESDRKEVLDAFGGGIRGLFRIDRSWKEETGIYVSQSSSSGTVAPWARDDSGGEGSSSGGGGAYTNALLSSQGSYASSRGAQNAENRTKDGVKDGENGMSVPTGWAVIGGKRSCRVGGRPLPPPPPSGGDNRNPSNLPGRFSLLGIAENIVSES